MKKVIFQWTIKEDGWPVFFIDGAVYNGLISEKVYYQTVYQKLSGLVIVTEDELFQED